MQTEGLPKFFRTPAAFRKWLDQNHRKKSELWVGFHKKDSGIKSITYAEALDEALCYGWIDGVRKSVDPTSYKIRFTPRKSSSIWSNVNVRHVERLKKQGRMATAGLEAYALRDPKRTGIYAFEKEAAKLTPEFVKQFQVHKAAWDFFQSQAPYYKRTITHWVVSAKREETRVRRLAQLIECSAKGVRVGLLEPSRTKNK